MPDALLSSEDKMAHLAVKFSLSLSLSYEQWTSENASILLSEVVIDAT